MTAVREAAAALRPRLRRAALLLLPALTTASRNFSNILTEAQGTSKGKGLTVNVTTSGTGTINALSDITVKTGGTGWAADDVFIIKGSQLGGTDALTT